MSERTEMPIMLSAAHDLAVRRGENIVTVQRIPWAMIAGTTGERQAKRNHDQTLDGLAGRGGLSACEAICIISCQPYFPIGTDDQVHRILYAMVVMFNRGQRVAEAKLAPPDATPPGAQT